MTSRNAVSRSAGVGLVALQPDVILASSTPTTTALLQQTRTIPIVFATVGDPIGSGFVASFPRPGGNVTGFITVEGSLGGKWLELLKEIAPRVNRIAFLLNPATATYAESYLNAFKAAAASVVVEAIVAPVHDRSEFDTVIAAQAREPNSGLIVIADAFTVAYRVEITSLAAEIIESIFNVLDGRRSTRLSNEVTWCQTIGTTKRHWQPPSTHAFLMPRWRCNGPFLVSCNAVTLFARSFFCPEDAYQVLPWFDAASFVRPRNLGDAPTVVFVDWPRNGGKSPTVGKILQFRRPN